MLLELNQVENTDDKPCTFQQAVPHHHHHRHRPLGVEDEVKM